MRKVLIISAHADDETFGMGATLAKFKEQGLELHWLIVTKLWEPRWSTEKISKRNSEIDAVSQYFNFSSTTQWDFQDNRLQSVDIAELQEKLIPYLESLKPDTIFCPGPWDFNHEHRICYEMVEMSVKPIYSPYIKNIYSYEIPSSTEYKFNATPSFSPNVYFEVSDYLDKKIEACRLYQDEIYPYPHGRSPQYLEVLAQKRGVEIGIKNAEAFVLLRQLL